MRGNGNVTRTQGVIVEGAINGQKPSDIWYALEDSSRYLYHYTTAETVCNFILPDQQLRFSRFENVNDPREARDWSLSLSGDEIDLEYCEAEELVSELNQRIKFCCKVGCFASDPTNAIVNRVRQDDGEDVLDAIYQRGHSRPNLWWHYGDKYRGVCLIFDRDQLEANVSAAIDSSNQMTESGLIVYKNPPIVPDFSTLGPLTINLSEVSELGIEKAARVHFDRFKQELFFTKSEDWAQEREFRFLVRGIDDADFYVSIKSALVGILVGDEFPGEFKPVVDRHAKKEEFSVAIMTWTNGVPQPKPAWKLT